MAREEGDWVAMRAALSEMRDRRSMDPRPWVYSIVQEYLAGQKKTSAEQLEVYFI
ncbi:MAG: hypothetical protein J6386_21875 [Candidatus Synoicihabitans palmerolidicus]|nr:hypothetical protein [Candidatus Synoicihabitans palmerolidicus]